MQPILRSDTSLLCRIRGYPAMVDHRTACQVQIMLINKLCLRLLVRSFSNTVSTFYQRPAQYLCPKLLLQTYDTNTGTQRYRKYVKEGGQIMREPSLKRPPKRPWTQACLGYTYSLGKNQQKEGPRLYAWKGAKGKKNNVTDQWTSTPTPAC